jgi:hypothetical protein
MKKIFYTMLVAAGISLSLSAISMDAQAYQCGWRNGHRVCWQNAYAERNCHWVKGYWSYGYYFRGHKVCW